MAAKIYITEYVSTKPIGIGAVMAQEPGSAEQLLNTTGTSAQSAAFGATTRFVRVHTDGIVSIKFGPNPTAVITAHRMAAGTTEYFAVQAGDKIAGIDNT